MRPVANTKRYKDLRVGDYILYRKRAGKYDGARTIVWAKIIAIHAYLPFADDAVYLITNEAHSEVPVPTYADVKHLEETIASHDGEYYSWLVKKKPV